MRTRMITMTEETPNAVTRAGGGGLLQDRGKKNSTGARITKKDTNMGVGILQSMDGGQVTLFDQGPPRAVLLYDMFMEIKYG